MIRSAKTRRTPSIRKSCIKTWLKGNIESMTTRILVSCLNFYFRANFHYSLYPLFVLFNIFFLMLGLKIKHPYLNFTILSHIQCSLHIPRLELSMLTCIVFDRLSESD